MLFEINPAITANTGETITLSGVNLRNITTVTFGNIQTTPLNVNDNSLDVIIPDNATSGNVSVANSIGMSNSFNLKITQEISGYVFPPEDSEVDVRYSE